MAQVQTKTYSRITPSAAQKFASKAYFLKLNISQAVSGMKQKMSKWTSRNSSHSPYSITIQDALDRNSAGCGSSSGFCRLLPLQ